MNSYQKLLSLGAGLLITATGLTAQTTPPAVPPAHDRPNVNASENAKAVQTLLQGFQDRRDQYIANRKLLIDQLAGATAAERQKILDELRADQKARSDEQRALAKQIRDELKKLRDARKGGGG